MKRFLLLFTLSIFFGVLLNGQTTKGKPKTWSGLMEAGLLANERGEYESAIKLYEKACNKAAKEFGTNHENYITALNNLAYSCQAAGWYEQAESLYLDLIDIVKSTFGEMDAAYATALDNLAGLYAALGRYDEAEPLYFTSTEIRKKKFGEKDIEYGTSLNNLAHFYHLLGHRQKAIPLYEQAIEIFKLELGAGHPDYATLLDNLGSLHQDMGNFDEAKPLYVESMEIRKTELGENHLDYANSLHNLAGFYKVMGEYDKSLTLYQTSLQIKGNQLGKDHPNYSSTEHNLAALYQEMGWHEEAEQLYLNSGASLQANFGENHIDYAASLNGLASLYVETGRLKEAESLYINANEIVKTQVGEDNIAYAISLSNLALLYKQMGQYEAATPLFIRANKIVKLNLGERHPEYATSTDNLASIYQFLGKYKEAELLFIEAKDIRKEAFGENHPDYAFSLNSLGFLYKKMKQYLASEEAYLEAIAIRKSSLGIDHPLYATSLNNLAQLYMAMEEYEKAEPLLISSAEVRKTRLGQRHPDYVSSLNNLAALYIQTNEYTLAELLFVRANTSLFEQFDSNAAHLSEKERRQYYWSLSSSVEAFNSFALKRVAQNSGIMEQVYNNRLYTKGLLYNSSRKVRQHILASSNPVLIAQYENWKNGREYLSKIYNLSIKARENQGVNIDSIELKVNQLEKELAKSSALFAKNSNRRKYTWQDVQKKLHPNEAAVELVRLQYFDKTWTDSVLYIALIVTPRTKDNPEFVVLNNGKELEGKYLKAYRNAIKFKVEDRNSYDVYWSKIAERLSGVNKLYLSCDGAYHSLSLGALKNPVTQKYLADELDIQLMSSTKDLLIPKRKAKTKGKAHLFGAVDFNGAGEPVVDEVNEEGAAYSTQRFINGGTINPLPGTKVEINSLSVILNQAEIETKVYMEREATEPMLKSIDNPRILHIATHGFFLKDVAYKNGEESVIGISTKEILANPLLRSGLLMAQAKQAITKGGDGVLTAFEVINLNLDQTELVVMSACETGLGEVKNGEGVYGLQRAFQTAGANNVLMSLWSVSDEATQQLMTLFYDNWLTKAQSKRQALKNAQSKLRETYPEPYYWAAFVMVGG